MRSPVFAKGVSGLVAHALDCFRVLLLAAGANKAFGCDFDYSYNALMLALPFFCLVEAPSMGVKMPLVDADGRQTPAVTLILFDLATAGGIDGMVV